MKVCVTCSAEPADCVIGWADIRSCEMTLGGVTPIDIQRGTCPKVLVMVAGTLILPFIYRIFKALHTPQESITVIDLSSRVTLAVHVLMMGTFQTT